MLNEFQNVIDENGSVDLIELRREASKLQAEEMKRLSGVAKAKLSSLFTSLFSFGATRHA